MKENKLDKKKYKMHSFRRKRAPKKYNGLKSSDQGNKKFNEKPDAKWNKGSGDLRARPHPAKLPTCEKELKKS